MNGRSNSQSEVFSMRRAITTALLLGTVLLSTSFGAQDAEQERFKKSYEKALTAEFISHGNWITDYDLARERAKKEGKVIFVFFSRSYAP